MNFTRIAGWFTGALGTLILVAVLQAQEYTLLSYNIRIARGMTWGEIDVPRVAKVVTDAQPDLVGLQEVDAGASRSEGRFLLEELAQITKFHPTFGPAIDLPGGKYGCGILSKATPTATRYVPLPGAEERRVLVIAEFPDYVFFCTHFSLTQKSRMESVEIIQAEAAKYADSGKPLFLVGDFNAEPASEEIQTLEKSWTCVSPRQPSWPADNPRVNIDFIFVQLPTNMSVRVLESSIVNEPAASDHRPVRAKIVLEEK